nr:MAG TPA: hypothetical protein [Inoviridae sp.]
MFEMSVPMMVLGAVQLLDVTPDANVNSIFST